MNVDLLSNFFNGDRRALARIITHVDNRSETGLEIMNHLYSRKGKAHIVGLTGPPGAGKSTLVNSVIREYRRRGKSVGVIAIDPTSPYSNGAILGDRVRMLEFTHDKKVYIRSMASRGRVGGLSSSTFDCITLFDIFGFDKIIVETVGAGQSEIDIVQTCDTTIVLAVPGLGDEIQILKAGIMEIADIFSINKSDKVGAKELGTQISNLLHMSSESIWDPPICLTSAINGTGISKLVDEIDEHWKFLNSNNINRLRKDRFKKELLIQIGSQLIDKIENTAYIDDVVTKILNGCIKKKDAIDLILENITIN